MKHIALLAALVGCECEHKVPPMDGKCTDEVSVYVAGRKSPQSCNWQGYNWYCEVYSDSDEGYWKCTRRQPLPPEVK